MHTKYNLICSCIASQLYTQLYMSIEIPKLHVIRCSQPFLIVLVCRATHSQLQLYMANTCIAQLQHISYSYVYACSQQNTCVKLQCQFTTVSCNSIQIHESQPSSYLLMFVAWTFIYAQLYIVSQLFVIRYLLQLSLSHRSQFVPLD